MRLSIPALSTTLLLALASFALAQQTTGKAMSDAQIKQQLQSQGYSNVQITEHDKSHVDVTATKNGKTQKLAVDPQTGKAMPDTDNDKD